MEILNPLPLPEAATFNLHPKQESKLNYVTLKPSQLFFDLMIRANESFRSSSYTYKSKQSRSLVFQDWGRILEMDRGKVDEQA